jgi:hypothetical protein
MIARSFEEGQRLALAAHARSGETCKQQNAMGSG